MLLNAEVLIGAVHIRNRQPASTQGPGVTQLVHTGSQAAAGSLEQLTTTAGVEIAGPRNQLSKQHAPEVINGIMFLLVARQGLTCQIFLILI